MMSTVYWQKPMAQDKYLRSLRGIHHVRPCTGSETDYKIILSHHDHTFPKNHT